MEVDSELNLYNHVEFLAPRVDLNRERDEFPQETKTERNPKTKLRYKKKPINSNVSISLTAKILLTLNYPFLVLIISFYCIFN